MEEEEEADLSSLKIAELKERCARESRAWRLVAIMECWSRVEGGDGAGAGGRLQRRRAAPAPVEVAETC